MAAQEAARPPGASVVAAVRTLAVPTPAKGASLLPLPALVPSTLVVDASVPELQLAVAKAEGEWEPDAPQRERPRFAATGRSPSLRRFAPPENQPSTPIAR